MAPLTLFALLPHVPSSISVLFFAFFFSLELFILRKNTSYVDLFVGLCLFFLFYIFLQSIRFINSLSSVCFIYLNYNVSDRISCLATFQWQNLFRRICNAHSRGQENL